MKKFENRTFWFFMNTPALPDCAMVRKTIWEPVSFQYLVYYTEIDTDDKLLSMIFSVKTDETKTSYEIS